MQDNNENNNVNVETENVRETVNQKETPMPVNTVEENNVSKKKSNKKIIIMIAIIILVLVIGVLAFFIVTKDDGSNKENNPNSNNSVTDVDNNDENNKSLVLANVKLNDEYVLKEIRDKKYYIYKSNDGSIFNYVILPESDNNPRDYYTLSNTYTCSDNCIFRDGYFIHEDESLEYFDYKNGNVANLKFVKKYETIDTDLVLQKYSSGNTSFYYSEFRGDTSFGIVENNSISLNFENLNLFVTSSENLIENGTYMLSTYDEKSSAMEFEIFTSTVNKLGHNNETIEVFLGSISLNYDNNNYIIRSDALDCDYIVILNSEMKKIVSYYNYVSDCLMNDGEYYCYLNDFDFDGTTSAVLSKFNQEGKETVIKKYRTIIELNKDFLVMGLTNDNYYEIFDVKNNKVLYSFDKLTSTQKQCYCSFFENFNYFDEKTNTFHAFVDDESLTDKDFPNENHDPEKDNYVNMFGYEYTYNVKTGEGKVTKKATFTQQE